MSHVLREPEETLGQLIVRLRDNKGLTQAEFGKRVGLSRRAVQLIEGHRGRPPLRNETRTIRRMASVLDVPVIVLSQKLGWVALEEFRSPDWEVGIWSDERFSDSDKQMLIHAGRAALAANRTETSKTDTPANR